MRSKLWLAVFLLACGTAWTVSADKKDDDKQKEQCKVSCSSTYMEELKRCPSGSADTVAALQCQQDAQQRYNSCVKGCGK